MMYYVFKNQQEFDEELKKHPQLIHLKGRRALGKNKKFKKTIRLHKNKNNENKNS